MYVKTRSAPKAILVQNVVANHTERTSMLGLTQTIVGNTNQIPCECLPPEGNNTSKLRIVFRRVSMTDPIEIPEEFEHLIEKRSGNDRRQTKNTTELQSNESGSEATSQDDTQPIQTNSHDEQRCSENRQSVRRQAPTSD